MTTSRACLLPRPQQEQTDEGISTCRFAQRVAQVTNVAQINEDLDPTMVIARLRQEIQSLRAENAFLKSEGAALEGVEMGMSTSPRLQ